MAWQRMMARITAALAVFLMVSLADEVSAQSKLKPTPLSLDAKRADLAIGQFYVVALDFMPSKVVIVDPQVADLEVKSGETYPQIHLVGRGPGATDFSVFDTENVQRISLQLAVSSKVGDGYKVQVYRALKLKEYTCTVDCLSSLPVVNMQSSEGYNPTGRGILPSTDIAQSPDLYRATGGENFPSTDYSEEELIAGIMRLDAGAIAEADKRGLFNMKQVNSVAFPGGPPMPILRRGPLYDILKAALAKYAPSSGSTDMARKDGSKSNQQGGVVGVIPETGAAILSTGNGSYINAQTGMPVIGSGSNNFYDPSTNQQGISFGQ